MEQYQFNGAPSVTGDNWELLGTPPEEGFTDSNTAAQVTATVSQGQSSDYSGASGILGICYEPAGGTGITEVSQISVGLSVDEATNGVTVSGVVSNLTPGEYYVGLCAKDQNNNDNGNHVTNGDASVTIIMAETASGANNGTRQGATPTRPPHGMT